MIYGYNFKLDVKIDILKLEIRWLWKCNSKWIQVCFFLYKLNNLGLKTQI